MRGGWRVLAVGLAVIGGGVEGALTLLRNLCRAWRPRGAGECESTTATRSGGRGQRHVHARALAPMDVTGCCAIVLEDRAKVK